MTRHPAQRPFSIWPILLANGYSPLPCMGKRQVVRNWPAACRAPLPAADLERFASSPVHYNVSVACGFGGLVVLDRDTDDPDIMAALAPVIPRSPVRRIGSKGAASFFRASMLIRSQQIRACDGVVIMDVLASGRACVIPPSIHPDTGSAYRWLGSRTLLNTSATDLPVITQADIERIREVLAPWLAMPRVVDVRPARPPVPIGDDDRRRYDALARASLAGAAADLAAMKANSGRNSALFAASCRLGKFAHNGILAPGQIVVALARAAEANGLAGEDGRGAVAQTIASGLRRAINDALPVLGERDMRHA